MPGCRSCLTLIHSLDVPSTCQEKLIMIERSAVSLLVRASSGYSRTPHCTTCGGVGGVLATWRNWSRE